MDENGPQPRVKYRTVQKRRNGADQFRNDHLKDYDTCDERGSDAVNRARRHNQAVPKLNDELKKRKSITTVTTIKMKDLGNDFDPNCSACAKLITLKELQKLDVKPRCIRSKQAQIEKKSDAVRTPVTEDKKYIERQSRHRQKLGGITKKERPKLMLSIKNLINRSCQCVIEHKYNEINPKLRTTKSSLEKNMQNTVSEEIDSKPHDEKQSIADHDTNQPTKTKSKQTLKSQNRSNSSYNSYLSMSHEPMDYS